MSRRAEIEVFSLSFLDLICCGMAGILVLYTTAAPEAPDGRTDERPPRVLTVEFPIEMAGAEFALEFKNGRRVWRGTSDGGRSDWLFSINPPQAVLQFDEPLERGNAILRVWIRDFDLALMDTDRPLTQSRCYFTLIDPANGMKYRSDSRKPLSLDDSNGFDASVQLQ